MAVSLGLPKEEESEGFPRVNLLWDVHLTSPAACGTALSAGIQVGLGALHGAGSLSSEYMLLCPWFLSSKPTEPKSQYLWVCLTLWLPFILNDKAVLAKTCVTLVLGLTVPGAWHSEMPGSSGLYRDYPCPVVNSGSSKSTEPQVSHSGSTLETLSQSIKVQ